MLNYSGSGRVLSTAISIIYQKGEKASLNLCFKGLFLMIRISLITCKKRNYTRKDTKQKADLNAKNSLIKKANKQK
jgi:hypothetical protein